LEHLNGIKIDTMRQMIEAFPALLRATTIDDEIIQVASTARKRDLYGVCMVGMGGSGIAGEMCKGLVDELAPIPIITVNDYMIPSYVNKRWAVIVVSYSGNTEETLSAFEEARKRKCSIFIITAGGTLGKLAEELPIHILPKGLQPRAALPLIFSIELNLLEEVLGVSQTDLVSVSNTIESLDDLWGSALPTPKSLASVFNTRIPLFIGSSHLSSVGYRAKCQINENAKMPAFYSTIPESNHNEIEASPEFDKRGLKPVFLRSKFEDERIARRYDATSAIYIESGAEVIQLEIFADSRVVETLALTHYLDMTSLELAEMRGVDPLLVDRIAELKQSLSGHSES
jgi:glucose/mannose-6-phosphate isomerase